MTMRRLACALSVGFGLFWPVAGTALTIYPVDRAEILAGSRFDFKVEFDGVIAEQDVKVTVNGTDPTAVFGRAVVFAPKEKGVDSSALIVHDVALPRPGR